MLRLQDSVMYKKVNTRRMRRAAVKVNFKNDINRVYAFDAQ